MHIGRALKIIERGLQDPYKQTIHFKERILSGNVEYYNAISIIKKAIILGIVEQDREELKYIITLLHNENKDLNIVLKIQPTEKLVFITVMGVNAERRTKCTEK